MGSAVEAEHTESDEIEEFVVEVVLIWAVGFEFENFDFEIVVPLLDLCQPYLPYAAEEDLIEAMPEQEAVGVAQVRVAHELFDAADTAVAKLVAAFDIAVEFGYSDFAAFAIDFEFAVAAVLAPVLDEIDTEAAVEYAVLVGFAVLVALAELVEFAVLVEFVELVEAVARAEPAELVGSDDVAGLVGLAGFGEIAVFARVDGDAVAVELAGLVVIVALEGLDLIVTLALAFAALLDEVVVSASDVDLAELVVPGV